ncbi:hypothetical protein [Streptosporangium sandarakinum]
MSFEERILMELKDEITARAERRRRTGRRLFAGAAVAGLAAAAAIVVPLLTGAEQPAYAVTRNTDGTIDVRLNEFRDADKLEQDLGKLGVNADITYLPPGKWCGEGRGKAVGGDGSPEDWDASASGRAARLDPDGLRIDPRYAGKGRTLVMMFSEARNASAGSKPKTEWQFGSFVVEGPVQPCVVVDNPLWKDTGGSGQPPAGD